MTLTDDQMKRQVKATAKYEALNRDRIVARVPIGTAQLIEKVLNEKPGGYAARAITAAIISELGETRYKDLLEKYKQIELDKRKKEGKI